MMRKPADSAELLEDLKRLHQQLSRSTQVTDPVPVLEDIVTHEPYEPLSFEQQLLIHATETLLPEIIQEFTPLIAQELSRRLETHVRAAVKQQVQSATKHTPR